jgi:hypothetical protein
MSRITQTDEELVRMIDHDTWDTVPVHRLQARLLGPASPRSPPGEG